MLPDAVAQQMGWVPPPPGDPTLGGDPGAPPPYALDPAVLQSMGAPAPLAPPPAAAAGGAGGGPGPGQAPGLPALPAFHPGADGAAGPVTSPGPPPEAGAPLAAQFPHGAGTPAPAAASPPTAPAANGRPLSVEQQLNKNQGDLSAATQEAKAASAAQTQAQLGQAAGDLAAEQDYAARMKLLQDQAAKQRDDANHAHLLAQRTVTDRMKALDDYKIDQNEYWHSMGIGNKISWFVGLALAGIGNAFAGKGNEPNQVLQMLQQKMQQSIVLQQDKREQLEKGLGRSKDLMAEGDLYQAKRAADIAAAEADATKMLKIQVDLATAKQADPMIRANGMAESAKLDRQLATDQQTAIEKLANYNIQKQQVGIAGGHLALARQQFAAEYGPQGFKQQELDLRAADESRKMAADEAKAAAKKAGKLDENQVKYAVSAPVQGSGGKAIVLMNADGQPWLGHEDKEETQKTSNLIAAVDEYHQLAAKMIQDIKTHGGESDYIKSDTWQRQQSRLMQIQADLHDIYDIKRFSEGTQDLFNRVATAGIDPTSFIRDASKALKTSSTDLTEKVNSKLRAANYTGKPIEFPDLSKIAEAPPSPQEQRQTLLKSAPNVSYDDALRQALPFALQEHAGDPTAAVRAARAEAEQYKNVAPAQRRAINALITQGDAAAESELEQYALPPKEGGSHSAAIREMAQQALSTIRFNRAEAERTAAQPQSQNFDPNGYDPASLVRRFNQPQPVQPTIGR